MEVEAGGQSCSVSKRLHAGPHMVGSRAVTEWNDRNQHHRSTLSLNMKGLLLINVTKNSLSGALQYTCFYVTR